MTRDEWARVKGIVADALLLPAGERSGYLAGECGADAAMRQEARSLLAATVDAADLYERSTLSGLLSIEALADFAPEHQFPGTERYTVRRRVGVGGMGIVYEVHDTVRDRIVALKTLLRRSPSDVYRLKREFRSLANIAHPNLVSLYDLVVDERLCFFTMELVEGTTFVEHVRGARSEGADIPRVRRALAQLVEGVGELHRRGKLHRDIKPTNVLVTPDGRVVILDFGLTSDAGVGIERGLAGTPAYLSPEQCAGAEATEASDWYSIGVTLYHALTGRAPFDGDIGEVIQRKMAFDPPPPSAIAGDVPDDLNDLCVRLLSRDPGLRMPVRADASPAPVFVGREQYLDVLGAALEGVKQGRSASVYIHGPSGIGKSALVQRFFDRRANAGAVIALRGRCHEHESMPYKGLDGVIDSLSRYLEALPREDAARVMPRHAAALVRLFPVLQVDGISAPALAEQDLADPVALRARAIAALRDLLSGLARRQPLVLEIDDFQWADVDSAVSLTELLRPPDPPPLLLLVSFRSEELESKPFLRALAERVDAGTKIALPLAPMTEAEVSRLIEALTPADAAHRGDRIEIARQAGGNPFLVEEMARYAALGDAHHEATLGEMLQRRVDALPPGSRAFLETLAVCGRPILPARVFEACGLEGDERPLVARLRSAHFLRTSRTADRVELYHDRIRETLRAQVSPDAVRAIHELMARIVVSHGDDDPEALFEHYRGAGDMALAAVQAATAAAKASAVLAFDRAAAFYRHALELQPDGEQHSTWTAGLARALENAGRPAEAADACLDVARRANDVQRVEWMRKAAEQLLVGGHIDRGIAIIDSVLPTVGMRLARGPRSALASILARRVQLNWRGLDFVEREASQIAPEDLLRIDACWSITTGLAMVDNIRAAAFHVRQLQIALDTGEPYRIARALALEAGFSALGGGRGIERSAAFAARAQAMAERIRHPHVMALVSMSSAIAAFVHGRFRQATDHCERALTLLRDECSGVNWEMNLTQDFLVGSLLFRGELRDVSHWMPSLIQSARERGNLYFETELRTRMNLFWLAADEPDEGEREANDAISRWSTSGFHRQHYNHLLARIQTALYRGRSDEAWRVVSEQLAPVRRHLWLRVQFFRVEVAFMRARSALGMAASSPQQAPYYRRIAADDARRLAREQMPWSSALALFVRATIAYQEGNQDAAAAQLDQAIDAFTHVDMHLYAFVARRRLAGIVGGDRGRSLRREADDWMRMQEIRDPGAISRLVAPGFPDEKR